MKYVKKNVAVEALLFDGTIKSFLKIKEWAESNGGDAERFCFKPNRIAVPTLDGSIIANGGDYIVKGPNGEFYPCKPDVFDMSYDKQTEE